MVNVNDVLDRASIWSDDSEPFDWDLAVNKRRFSRAI